MSHAYPRSLYQHVRDHLERAAAILQRDEATLPIRNKIEEAIDLALECAYRPSSAPPVHCLSPRPLRPVSGLVAANDNGARQ